ncbi:MAG: hypothetical protein H8E44_24020 [Planctomycetes bacterium]|nr:hypothetical protein [Planctomycetota bacterium]MBL7040882.1 hypothetical protein [Pirellulaceae bacterium]
MSEYELSRRQFVGGSLAASLLTGMQIESRAEDAEDGAKYRMFWGDIHNHNEVGYAKGSLARSIDNAQEHLDFFAFTGHSSWHDMPKMPEDRHMKWVNGFKVQADHWPKTRQMIREANTEDFTALLGYEWHSSRFGDYCMIFPDDQPDLYLPDHVEKLLDFAESKGAMAVPHHVAYARGWRGANFDHFRPSASPIVEIFSEHGCSESVTASGPFIRHSMGGRDTVNTIQRQLEKGLRFGFAASSDSHRGYPGAYGEGVVGVWARDLSAASLFEAFRARRTCAATGDRIVLDVTLNGQPMGSQISSVSEREIDVSAQGQDAIAMIELVRNGAVIHRHFPEDHFDGRLKLPGKTKCRIRYGWGPWAALDLGRTCLWDMDVRIDGGQFTAAVPCFQSAPYEEDLRDRLRIVSPTHLHLASYTSRVKCFAEDPTKAIVCELDAGPDAVMSITLRKPCEQTVKTRLADLKNDNQITFTGGFTTESFMIHPLLAPEEYTADLRFQDRRPADQGTDWYYVRVTEKNGHMAWSTPIWVG